MEVKEYARDALARFYMRVELCGDILIAVKHQGAFNRPKLFRVGLHTGMIDISKAVRIPKADIDGTISLNTNFRRH